MEVAVTTHPVSNVRSNIWKLYAVQCLTQALFAIPIMFLFWENYGLNMRQIMMLQATFAVTILFLEIPTGYIADRWGRKNSIVIGCFFATLGYLAYANSHDFWQFLIAEMTIGIGASFLSGALEALTFDTLLTLGEEGRYRRMAGNMNFLEFGTEAMSGLIGGLLAVISLTLPLWVAPIPMAIAFSIALTLREPVRHGLHELQSWKAIWDVTTHTLVTHRGLRNIIVLHASISMLTLSYFWFFQPYQQLVGIPVGLFGLTHAVSVMAGAFASKYVTLLEKRVDDRLILMGISTTVVVCYLLMGMTPTIWLVGAFFVSRFAWGALGPLTADMVNRMTTSNVRATVLSLRSFVTRIIFCTSAPFIGLLADRQSITFALVATGMVGGLIMIFLFMRMKPVWKEIPS